MSGINITSIIDGSVGTAQGRSGTTVQTFLISLASGVVLFSVQFFVFLGIRIYPWSKRIFQPRAFLVPRRNRISPPSNNPLRWLLTVFQTPASTLLEKSGMDGYFFIRYLGMCLKIFLPMTLIILPILLPLNAAGGKDNRIIDGTLYNVTGIDKLAWSNIAPDQTSRYWAHLILAVGSIIWVCFVFHEELMHYIQKRQEYLSSSGHRLRASATSVLITDIPSHLCTVEKLTEHYDDFPGGIRRIWINRDFSPLVEKFERRAQIEDRLETAETNLIRTCVKIHKQRLKQQGTTSDGTDDNVTKEQGQQMQDLTPKRNGSLTRPGDRSAIEKDGLDKTIFELCEQDLKHDIDTQAAWTKFISPSKRAKTRIAKIGHETAFKIPLFGNFFGRRVDTIYLCRRQLAELNVDVERETELSDAYPAIHSAFLQFNDQKAAHLACQGLSHPSPRAMTRRTVELAPGDINWQNLGLPWWQRYLRFFGFLLLFVFLIFVFGLISVFTGILSKVSSLGDSTSWLRWIQSLPSWLLSFIQGTLPPVILIIVLSGPLPIFLRMFTNGIKGSTTGTQGERALQLWYFIFLLFELFIVPTISSGLTAVVKELVHDPTSVPNILATNLPTAANYYFSFLIVQALSISASSILQTIRLLNYYVLGSTNTPDSVFNSLTFTNRTRIGSNIPWYTTYAVIGLTYSVIAPLMLIFMLITFGLFWIVIKSNILYVVRTGDVDGGGLFYPDAINQTFTGIYFLEICLIGLFFLVRDDQDRVSCEAQGIIMAVVLVFTIMYQTWLFRTFQPLSTYLPIMMQGDARQGDVDNEMQPLTMDEKCKISNEEALADDGIRFSVDEPAVPSSPGSGKPILDNDRLRADQRRDGKDTSDRTRRYSRGSLKPVMRPQSEHGTTTGELMASARAEDMKAQQERDEQSAKRILARLNRPLDEARFVELEHRVTHAVHNTAHALAPIHSADAEKQLLDDPISKIIMQHNDDLESLDQEERDLLISVAFTHPVLRAGRPSVWIPQDGIGVSDDEVRRTRQLSEEVVIHNRGAFFNRKLRVEVDRPPPDMSEFALLMDEL